jgi:hypothetical protein
MRVSCEGIVRWRNGCCWREKYAVAAEFEFLVLMMWNLLGWMVLRAYVVARARRKGQQVPVCVCVCVSKYRIKYWWHNAQKLGTITVAQHSTAQHT